MKCKQTNYKKKLIFRFLTIILVAGVTSIAVTAPAGNSNGKQQEKSKSLSYFDPFTLQTVNISPAANGLNNVVLSNPVAAASVLAAVNSLETNASVENLVVTRPAIRVPYKPPFRSPYQPPWAPGPPDWAPGPPPWANNK